MKFIITPLVCLLLLNTTSKAQTDCNARFTSDDVLRWRQQLLFTPHYISTKELDYLIANFSDRAYYQLHLDIAVACYDQDQKQEIVKNMSYYWNNKISQNDLYTYFPAYYIFYFLDKQ